MSGELRDKMELFEMKIEVRESVAPDTILVVQPRRNPTDRRTDAERTITIINVA
jgi:hypothetical protein